MPEIMVTVSRQENAEYFGCLIGDTVPVDFEKYVAAVVGSEIGNAHEEACRAQAVAARTYAVKRGVLNGKAISDSSATAQAYRAKRCDPDRYPNCLKAAGDTAGVILTYRGKAIDAVYSGNNGGRTVSSKERWGNTSPYLIAQEDPWDAADGRTIYGHGVGMSQRGAMWAANHGVGWKEILRFYYPGTELTENYGESVVMNEKAQTIVRMAKERLGCPYKLGALGEIINGKQTFDCRGLTWWLLHQVGVEISTVGATTQYKTAGDWVEQGHIRDMPNLVCPVFMYKSAEGKMSHTGMHIGDGVIIHCTSNGGTKYGSTADSGWTHYAIPKGLYAPEEIERARKEKIMRTLKIGSSGSDVLELQQTLNDLGYECGTPDGKFGSRTALAVKMFQTNHGLTADGVVGALTWAALHGAGGDDSGGEKDRKMPDEIRGMAYELYLVLKKYFDGEGT